jgi:hypothetical protein
VVVDSTTTLAQMIAVLHQQRPMTLQVSFKEYIDEQSRFVCWLAVTTE